MAVKYKLARCYGSKCIITTVLIMFTLHRNEVFDVISSYCFDCHSYADDSQMRTTVFPGHSFVVGRQSTSITALFEYRRRLANSYTLRMSFKFKCS